MKPTTVDAQAVLLGALIKELRREQHLTLVQVSRASGLSHPFLSQVENGRARPSFASLDRIARALGTTQFQLFGRIANGQGHAVDRSGGAIDRPSDTPLTGAFLDGSARVFTGDFRGFTPVEVLADNTDFVDYFSHEEEEFCYLLEGEVLSDLDGVLHPMSTGDAIYVPGGTPHRWRSANGKPFRLLFVKGHLNTPPDAPLDAPLDPPSPTPPGAPSSTPPKDSERA